MDTGKVAIGNKSVIRAINDSSAQAVIVSVRGKKEIIEDITHMCSVAQIKLLKFPGNSLELGTVCGKPFSVNALAVLSEGNSNILKENY